MDMNARQRAALDLLRSSAKFEIYLGAGGRSCFVTSTHGEGPVLDLSEVEAMERAGLLERKWPDYAHWWVVAKLDEPREIRRGLASARPWRQ